MSELKTNVSIKFSSIEEYIEIEKKLEEMGYVNDKEWNENRLKLFKYSSTVRIYGEGFLFTVLHNLVHEKSRTYNNLEEFLED